MQITALYAAPIALVFLALSWRVIAYRRAHRLGLGDHGDKSLMKRMRAQANCAEYAPIGLLMLALAESLAAPVALLHLLGLLLLLGRVVHGYGFSASPPQLILRQTGMLLTLASIALSAATAFILALGRLA